MDAFRQRCKELADRSVIVTNLVEAMRSMNKLERVVIKLGNEDDSPITQYFDSNLCRFSPFREQST